jgi:hypothetical protein
MAEPESVKATLETIARDLKRLARLASEAEQPLLAFMLEQAKAEAENQLR